MMGFKKCISILKEILDTGSLTNDLRMKVEKELKKYEEKGLSFNKRKL